MPARPDEIRSAVLARIATVSAGQPLGRTQLMKMLYFLQERKGAFLGYDFRLFTYGPFDSDVLGDLSAACGLDILTEETKLYSRGYGYDIRPAARAERLSRDLERENPDIAKAVDEVVREFGQYGAAELELRSTIYFVYREFAEEGRAFSPEEIAERVRQIKPYFDLPSIAQRVTDMAQNGHLQTPVLSA
jgi:uncharacterized protein